MKVAVVLFSLLALGFSAPRQSKLFHEHVEEFLDIIEEEAADAIDVLFEQYLEFDEFWAASNYMKSADFRTLIFEMEALPEFKAVIDFLENDNIDILYFIDRFNGALEQGSGPRKRQQASGKDLNAFINDSTALFPKAKLAALFDQKMSDDVDFRTAIENLQSEEWDNIWNALWENETFQAEVKILGDNGVDISVFLNELIAVFGQN